MTMKTRTITEDVDGTLNRRYFAEVEIGDELDVRREGKSAASAARVIVAALRYWADDAERKFIESGVLPTPPPKESA